MHLINNNDNQETDGAVLYRELECATYFFMPSISERALIMVHHIIILWPENSRTLLVFKNIHS